MKRAHLILSGKVQGVFFRDYARKEAQKLGVTGWVKNLQDDTVEVVAEGEDDKLNIFVRECKRGPLLAFIKNADVKFEEATGEFDDFSLRY